MTSRAEARTNKKRADQFSGYSIVLRPAPSRTYGGILVTVSAGLSETTIVGRILAYQGGSSATG